MELKSAFLITMVLTNLSTRYINISFCKELILESFYWSQPFHNKNRFYCKHRIGITIYWNLTWVYNPNKHNSISTHAGSQTIKTKLDYLALPDHMVTCDRKQAFLTIELHSFLVNKYARKIIIFCSKHIVFGLILKEIAQKVHIK